MRKSEKIQENLTNATTQAAAFFMNNTPPAPAPTQTTETQATAQPAVKKENSGVPTFHIRSTEKAETKSRRLQVLMKPSLYEILKIDAEKHNCSVNEMLNLILEAYKEGREK